MSFPEEQPATLPAAVHAIVSRLEREGFEAWVVGESLARLARGLAPAAFEVATTATPEQVLALFPHGVPTHPERGVVTVPTGAEPVDLTALRWGARVEDDLAHRDFTVLAMAWSPIREELRDPWAGRADLQAGRLRAVGDAAARLHEDPVRLLRAARLAADWSLEPDRALEEAMRTVAPALAVVPAVRLRAELVRLLLSPEPARGLDLLRRTGVEQRLVRDVRPDAAELVAALPARLELRLAAWLRGARARGLLRRLRFGLERSSHVERLLEHHPLDERVTATRDRSVLRLLRQLDALDVAGLFEMRHWELARAAASGEPAADVAEARKRLEALANAIERVRSNEARSAERTRLAVGGQQVMAWLGWTPGRQVGRALRFAREWVAEDPSRNEPERIREALLAWSRQQGEDER